MCSRGSVAVIDGDRSSATTIAGPDSVTSSVGRPARMRAIRSATSSTSAARAASSGSSSAASWAAAAAPEARIAATPSSPCSRIRDAAPSTSVGSQAIAAWAMKIAASSSCPSAPTRSDRAIRSSAAAFAASRSRASSASTASAATRPPTGSSRRRTWIHGPRATPGAAATPASRTAVNPMPPPDGPARDVRRRARIVGQRRRRRKGLPAHLRTTNASASTRGRPLVPSTTTLIVRAAESVYRFVQTWTRYFEVAE